MPKASKAKLKMDDLAIGALAQSIGRTSPPAYVAMYRKSRAVRSR